MVKKLSQKMSKKIRNLKYLSIFVFVIITLILLSNSPSIQAWDKSGNIYNCTNCSDCNNAIANASSGDIIQLNTSISNQNETCIEFNGEDNLTFDCLSYSNFIEGDGDSDGYGIYFNNSDTGSDNVIIRNCNISEFFIGLWVEGSYNNTLTNIISSNNVDYGIYLKTTTNSSLINIETINNGLGSGISLNAGSHYNIIKNVLTNNNKRGISVLSNNNYNTITNITANHNTEYGGIYIGFSSYTILTNITVTNNTEGVFFAEGSNNQLINVTSNSNTQSGIRFHSTANSHTIRDSFIENNTYGIYFSNYSSSFPYNNLIYNNFLNNSKNYHSFINKTNYFNTTKRIGLNILNGAWIAGNYWGYPNGTGFSDICTDADADGICDSAYNVDGVNQSYDYLPLSASQPTTCTSCSDCSTKIQSASSGETICLLTNINEQSGNCIEFIYKDNITFDCLNNYIQGDGTGTDYGIYLNYTGTDGSDNNTIKNCNISRFQTGIYLYYYSDGNNFINITTNNNTNHGIYLYQSDDNTLTDVISTNNPQRGIYIHSGSDNGVLTNITANNNNIGIYLFSDSNNNTLTNITTNNNTNGIYLFQSHNNTLTNITSKFNSRGLYVIHSSFNKFNNIITQENDYYDVDFYVNSNSYCPNNFTNVSGSNGRAIEYYNYSATIQNKTLSTLILCDADNSIVDNITIIGSDTIRNNYMYIAWTNNTTISNVISNENRYGVILDYSNNSALINITTNSNVYGISITNSHDNTVNNATINNNSLGLDFYDSSRNNLTNMSITNSNPNDGIRIRDVSTYNIINDSHIENSTRYGINFDHSGSDYPQYNTIYNNYFNNSVNYYNTTNLTNYFNTTNQSGPNIINGSYIGGNYWAYPNVTGFSQTCTDANSDGFCDSAYNVDDVNQSYDYLPLYCIENWSCTDWSDCSGSIQTRTCTDSNNCGTTNTRPALSQSCTVSNGGGGGSGNFTPPIQGVLLWTKITPGNITIVKDFDEELGIKQIQIEVNHEAHDVKMTITKYDDKPANVTKEKSGKVYKYLQIETENLDDKLNKSIITIQVNKSWVSNNNLDKNKIAMFKFINNEWAELPTIFSDEDSNYYYYDTEVDSFSYFSVGEIEEEIIEETKKEEGKIIFYILTMILIIAIIVVGFLLGRSVMKRNQFKRNI